MAGALTAGALTSRLAVAATGCRVDYSASQWQGGFTGSVKLTVGEQLNGWTLSWVWPSGQRITSAWNATVTQTESTVTAGNAAYNGGIVANGTVEFGFQGTWTSSNTAPTSFTLNGTVCAGIGAASNSTSGSASVSASGSASVSASGSASVSASGSASVSAGATGSASAGSADPSGSISPSGSGQPPAGCGTALLCDGFENQTTATPSGGWSVTAPDCSGSGTAAIDSSVAHTGQRSLRINGGGGYCNHVFVRPGIDLASVGNSLYVRFFVRHSTALPAGHVTFVSMPDSADGNKALRLGGQNGALQWNRESDDATLPVQSPVGVAQSRPLPTGSWQCLEFGVDRSAGTLRTWLNGDAVVGLTADGTPTPDVDQQWLARNWRPSVTSLRLGWESYGGGADTLWFDDVAVGSGRIGC